MIVDVYVMFLDKFALRMLECAVAFIAGAFKFVNDLQLFQNQTGLIFTSKICF